MFSQEREQERAFTLVSHALLHDALAGDCPATSCGRADGSAGPEEGQEERGAQGMHDIRRLSAQSSFTEHISSDILWHAVPAAQLPARESLLQGEVGVSLCSSIQQ